MRFFATFWSWLNGQLATYIGDNTARLAGVLEPAVVTLATVYVMAWGYLQLTGKIDEPVVTGLKRILVLALILGVGLRLWLYNTLIVDTFYRAPAELAAAMVGSADPVGTIDAIWESGGAVAPSRAIVCRSNRGPRRSDPDGRRAAHDVDGRTRFSNIAPSHADRIGAGRRRIPQFLRPREPFRRSQK